MLHLCYKQNASVLQDQLFIKACWSVSQFMRDSSNKDFDHLIPQLIDAIKRVNQIISFCPKAGLNDNFIVQFPQAIQLHLLLLQIIDICELTLIYVKWHWYMWTDIDICELTLIYVNWLNSIFWRHLFHIHPIE